MLQRSAPRIGHDDPAEERRTGQHRAALSDRGPASNCRAHQGDRRSRMTKKLMKALPDNRPDGKWTGDPYITDHCPPNLWPLILVGKLHEEAEEIREDMTNPDEYADV